MPLLSMMKRIWQPRWKVAVSAFGFQGQKCSACSRAIIHEKVYDEFVQRLAARVRKITVGPTKNPANWMGAVISASAQEKIMEYIEIGKGEGKLVVGGEPGPDSGFFIQPTVFKDVAAEARISREEIFGPVLAVTKARDFDETIKFANATDYGLTGAVYTRNRFKLEKAKREFHCGNLYLNRKCTGAMVGCHPFGGFNMSGTDSKPAPGLSWAFLAGEGDVGEIVKIRRGRVIEVWLHKLTTFCFMEDGDGDPYQSLA
jgi:1-pyrroline-5-carboxylate dehydrogenase